MSSSTTLPEPENESSPREELEARGDVYSLLGALLARAPDERLLRHLAALEIEDPSAALAGAWGALRAAAASASASEVVQEYNDLFIGLARGELVPYGSYYLTGFLMEKPLSVLRRDLASLGLARAEDVREPEDHAGALCETMSLLISLDHPDPLASQRRFFSTHLEPWMAKFFQDLSDAKAASFYRGVAALGSAFIALETEFYSMAV